MMKRPEQSHKASDPVDSSWPADLPTGTSYLSLRAGLAGPIVVLRTCGGDLSEHWVSVALDELAAECALNSVVSPLAVTIRRVQSGVECSLLGTSLRGPRRVPVVLGGALELARRGVHCVVRHEPQRAHAC